jgi:hypothetical protein
MAAKALSHLPGLPGQTYCELSAKGVRWAPVFGEIPTCPECRRHYEEAELANRFLELAMEAAGLRDYYQENDDE